MKKNKHLVSVVFITDTGYLMPTWVAARSLVESKDVDTELVIYIIGDQLNQEDKEKLHLIIHGIEGVSIIIIDVDSSKDLEGKVDKDVLKCWSPATLYKFLLCEVLPRYLNKVIYLDGDMIIRKDLSVLYETELEGSILGAVRDTFYDNIAHEKRMDLPGQYFNTGCLLLDLDKMRDEHISEKLLETKTNRPSLGLADQDTYNEVCRGRVKILSCRYNFYITSFLMNENINGFRKYTVCPYNTRSQMISDIAIIHMIHYRPWKLGLDKRILEKIILDPVPNIEESSIVYILKRWLQLYKISPFAVEDWRNITDERADISLSPYGLKTYERKMSLKFEVYQECRNGKIFVIFSIAGIRFITKITDPEIGKVGYRIL